MGLFHRNENEVNHAGGSKNVMESIQRANDTGSLIYLDPQQDFNTRSVITVAPNEQVIFIKNGEFYGVLPEGRHEVQTENYPVLSRIRNMLTGGMSTFTCQVYHVQTNEQNVEWGTASPIELQDFFLGGGMIGVPTKVRGAASFRVRFNIQDDDEAAVQTFMRLMGDKSSFTTVDLAKLFEAQISQKIATVIASQLQEMSRKQSINAISSELESFANVLTPHFDTVLKEYGLEVVNFSFYNLNIDETEERKKYLDRLIGAAHVSNQNYNIAVQQELLKDIATNQGAGGMAGVGAGMGMGMMAGGAFAQMGAGAFGAQPFAQQQQATAEPDPMESLKKMKQMLDAGLITQQVYDNKVAEIMSRL